MFACFPEAGWAERLVAPADYVAPMPEPLSWAQGAALPVAGVTALRTLALGGPSDTRVLVIGAAGGVGRLAVEIANHLGARVTAVVGSRCRAKGLTTLGAELVLDGVLQVDVDQCLSWHDHGALIERVREREASGKVVLTVGDRR